jgi:hypothetical protein
MTRWVLHIDLDQFIAAVEVLRRPELRGRPVVVGGDGDPAKRGVVSTASYEARAFGVHSGLALRTARRRCPDAVFLPVDTEAYEAASAEVMATLAEFDAVVEVAGWDEAFLAAGTDDPEALARRIQDRIRAVTSLECTVGIGENKLQAKLAAGFGKPAGIFRLTHQSWYEVLGDRPTDALWGVGTKTARRLAGLGIHTVPARHHRLGAGAERGNAAGPPGGRRHRRRAAAGPAGRGQGQVRTVRHPDPRPPAARRHIRRRGDRAGGPRCAGPVQAGPPGPAAGRPRRIHPLSRQLPGRPPSVLLGRLPVVQAAHLQDLGAQRLEPGQEPVQRSLVRQHAVHHGPDRFHRGVELLEVEQSLRWKRPRHADLVVMRGSQRRAPSLLGRRLLHCPPCRRSAPLAPPTVGDSSPG